MKIKFQEADFPVFDRVAVLGAGPSLKKNIKTINDYPCTVGVNYLYRIIPVTYNVVTHFQLIFDLWRGTDTLPEKTTLLYSQRSSDWMFQGGGNPPADGVMFREYVDLVCGASTIIPALHFASMIGMQVDVYGVDLRQIAGKQYTPGYPTQQQEPVVFNEWAELVRKQIIGLQKLGNWEINWNHCNFTNEAL